MTNFKEISTLGPEISARYAKDKEKIHPLFTRESPSFQPDVTVTRPSYYSELDLIFGITSANIPWAVICPPKNFFANRRNIFSSRLIPSLGSPEKAIRDIEKLKALSSKKKKTALPKEIEDQRKKLLEFFELEVKLARDHADIISFINEFKKG